MTTDMQRHHEWPIVSFSIFTLGVFAGNDLGPGFINAIGLAFLAVTAIWAVVSKVRQRSEAAGVQRAGA
jgi:hypothetical protein